MCQCCGMAVCGQCSAERLTHHPGLRVCSLCYKANEGNETARFALRPVPVLVFSGMLTKSNDLEGRLRSWKQRLCLLDSNGVLTYFKNYVVNTISPAEAEAAAAKVVVILGGWFEKMPNDKRKGTGAKKKRFFELHSKGINYFGKVNKGRGAGLKGAIELQHTTEIIRDNSTVIVVNADRDWRLVTASAAVAGHWVAKLREVVSRTPAEAKNELTQVQSMGDAAGVINVAEKCIRFIKGVDNISWPAACEEASAFRIVTENRIFNLFASNSMEALAWREAICLSAALCYGCGDKLFAAGVRSGSVSRGGSSGAAARPQVARSLHGDGTTHCIGLTNSGRLYHTHCFACHGCKSGNFVQTSKGGSAVRRITATVVDRFGEAIIMRPNGNLGCKACLTAGGGMFAYGVVKTANYKVVSSDEVALYVDRFCKAQSAATDEIVSAAIEEDEAAEAAAEAESGTSSRTPSKGISRSRRASQNGTSNPWSTDQDLAPTEVLALLPENERMAIMKRVATKLITMDEACDEIIKSVGVRRAAGMLPISVYCVVAALGRRRKSRTGPSHVTDSASSRGSSSKATLPGSAPIPIPTPPGVVSGHRRSNSGGGHRRTRSGEGLLNILNFGGGGSPRHASGDVGGDSSPILGDSSSSNLGSSSGFKPGHRRTKSTDAMHANAILEELSMPAHGPWPAVDFGYNMLHDQMFAVIRKCRGVTSDMLSEAFEQQPNDKNVLAGGNSGCIVVTSVNRRFVLKALRVGEAKVLSSLLPEFVEHVQRNPKTMIVTFLGMYEIIHQGKVMHYVIMENVLQGACDLPIHEMYDLKGSAIDRRAIKHESASTFKGTRKDMDLRRQLRLKREASRIQEQLKVDVAFLNGQGVMDYSLFVAVHNIAEDHAADGGSSGANPGPGPGAGSALGAAAAASSIKGFAIENAPFAIRGGGAGLGSSESIFFMGVIDLLQKWDQSKMLESLAKTKILGKDKEGISAVDPDKYAARFLSFLGGRIEE